MFPQNIAPKRSGISRLKWKIIKICATLHLSVLITSSLTFSCSSRFLETFNSDRGRWAPIISADRFFDRDAHSSASVSNASCDTAVCLLLSLRLRGVSLTVPFRSPIDRWTVSDETLPFFFVEPIFLSPLKRIYYIDCFNNNKIAEIW